MTKQVSEANKDDEKKKVTDTDDEKVKGADPEGDKDVEVQEKGGKKKFVKDSYREEDQPEPEVVKKKLSEDINVIFEGTELSEGVRTRIETLFKAAVNEGISSEVERIEEQAQKAVEEEVAKIEENLIAKTDEYLSAAVNEWISDNRLALEQGIRLDMAESFIENLRVVFENHDIDIPEAKVDMVDQLSRRVEELEESLNKTKKQNIELTKAITEAKVNEVFKEVTEGLADTQVERFKKLSEGIEFTDETSFREKLTIIKEAHFSGGDVSEKQSEEKQKASLTEGVDPNVKKYAEFLSRRKF